MLLTKLNQCHSERSEESLFFAVVAAVLLLCVSAARAAAPAVSVDASVDKSEITVGDIVTLTLTVRHEQRASVQFPTIEGKLGEFVVREKIATNPIVEDGIVTQEMAYKITAYLTGELSVPAMKVSYSYSDDSGKSVTDSIETEPVPVRIRAVAPEDATDIRDIKAPVEIPVGWRYYAFWGGAGALAIALAALGILYWNKWRKPPEERAPLAPPRPAHEVALERLASIEQMDFVAQGRFKEYYDLVTGVLREYIGARYTLDALEMTTSELIRGLKPNIRELEVKNKIESILEEGDMVKFAKYTPQKELADTAIADTRSIIERTIPWVFKQPGSSAADNPATKGMPVPQAAINEAGEGTDR